MNIRVDDVKLILESIHNGTDDTLIRKMHNFPNFKIKDEFFSMLTLLAEGGYYRSFYPPSNRDTGKKTSRNILTLNGLNLLCAISDELMIQHIDNLALLSKASLSLKFIEIAYEETIRQAVNQLNFPYGHRLVRASDRE